MHRVVITLVCLFTAGSESSAASPPSGPRAVAWMDPAWWFFQHSPGIPANPTADSGGGWRFDFPSRDGVHYLVTPVAGFITGAFRAHIVITAETDTTFRRVRIRVVMARLHSAHICNERATKGPLRMRTTGGGDCRRSSHRAKSSSRCRSILASARKWFGRDGSERPSAFQAAISNVQLVGLTFGGCFAGHGVYVAGAPARCIVRSFSID